MGSEMLSNLNHAVILTSDTDNGCHTLIDGLGLEGISEMIYLQPPSSSVLPISFAVWGNPRSSMTELCVCSVNYTRSSWANVVYLPTGNAGAMGTLTTDFQHHQIRAEEEPPGSAGCTGVLQLQEDLQQPEVHEFHRYLYGCFVQLCVIH